MKKLMKSSIATLAVIAIAGCGGSSSSSPAVNSETLSGQFIDSAVAGVSYTCAPSGKSGTTSSEGNYTCAVDDNVTFLIGTYVLGTAPASKTITPFSLYPDDSTAAINVASLLQTLDTDGNASNGIDIPTDYTALDDVNASPADPDFVTEVEAATGDTLVDATDAATHLVTNLLAGAYLYTTIYDVNDSLESWSFNGNASLATVGEIIGGSSLDEYNITVSGMGFHFANSSESGDVNITSISDDHIVVKNDLNQTIDLYYSLQDASTNFFGGQLLQTLLPGNTFYATIDQTYGTMESWDISQDGTQVTVTELYGCGGNCSTDQITITLSGLTVTGNGDKIVFKDLYPSPRHAVIKINDQPTQEIYSDYTEAAAAFGVLLP